jgi:protein-S-isoprenylcysteine O-methyltransferase Ste14
MMWLALYLWLTLINMIVSLRVVPRQHLLAYGQCKKTWDVWVGTLLGWSVPACGIVEIMVDPKAFPIIWRLYGALLLCGANALVMWAQRVNPYFICAVQMPKEIITTGPYSFCNHPGFLGFALASLACVLILSSTWAIIPMCIYWLLLAWRVVVENRLLSNG